MEPFTFRAISKYLSIHIKREIPHYDINGQAHPEPAKIVHFHEGLYVTRDPEEADLIRNSGPFQRHEVFELTQADRAAFKPEGQKTNRGLISTSTFQNEAAGLIKQPQTPPGVSICDVPGCGKEFANDRYGRKIRMHKMTHRKSLRVEVK